MKDPTDWIFRAQQRAKIQSHRIATGEVKVCSAENPMRDTLDQKWFHKDAKPIEGKNLVWHCPNCGTDIQMKLGKL